MLYGNGTKTRVARADVGETHNENGGNVLGFPAGPLGGRGSGPC